MNKRTRTITAVALIGVLAIIVAVVLARGGGQAALPTTPQATPSSDWTPTAEPPAPLPTQTPDPTIESLLATAAAAAGEVYPPPTLTPQPPTPTPLPTMTAEEQALVIELQDANPQTAASVDECPEILETETGCNVVWYARHITRPEWEALFPRTEFILVKYTRYGGEFVEQHNVLLIEQDGQRYTAETFDDLLAANGIITTTDENRETVARAFVLMTLPDYLEEEITLSELEKGDWQAPLDFRYNYMLTAWTKIQGLRIVYLFLFDQGRLRMVGGQVTEYNTGDYIYVPFEILSPPSQEALCHTYWGR